MTDQPVPVGQRDAFEAWFAFSHPKEMNAILQLKTPHHRHSQIGIEGMDAITLKLHCKAAAYASRQRALKEAAEIVDNTEVVQFSGWERQDNGQKTLWKAEAAILALIEKE
jgi:hypothetical protein